MINKITPLLAVLFFAFGIFVLSSQLLKTRDIKQIIPPHEEIQDKDKVEECYQDLGGYTRPGSMPEPSGVFCQCMGGEMSVEKSKEGETGLCTIGGKTYDSWEYFRKMNPYDNTYAPSIKGYDEWRKFCQANRTSIYCKPFIP